MILVDYLHTNIVVQWLVHYLLGISLYGVHSLPYLLFVGTENSYVVTIQKQSCLGILSHISDKKGCIVIGECLYRIKTDTKSDFTSEYHLMQHLPDTLIAEGLTKTSVYNLLDDVLIELHKIQFDEIYNLTFVFAYKPVHSICRKLHTLALDTCIRVVHNEFHECGH